MGLILAEANLGHNLRHTTPIVQRWRGWRGLSDGGRSDFRSATVSEQGEGRERKSAERSVPRWGTQAILQAKASPGPPRLNPLTGPAFAKTNLVGCGMIRNNCE